MGSLQKVKHQRQWVGKGETPAAQAKHALFPRMVLLPIWWDIKGLIYFKLLNTRQTITSEIYRKQLERFKTAPEEKRPFLVPKQKVSFIRTTLGHTHYKSWRS